MAFLDPEAILLLLLLLDLGISALKIPKAFLTRSGSQQNFADILHRSVVSDFPLIF